jgi:hypothetical protein
MKGESTSPMTKMISFFFYFSSLDYKESGDQNVTGEISPKRLQKLEATGQNFERQEQRNYPPLACTVRGDLRYRLSLVWMCLAFIEINLLRCSSEKKWIFFFFLPRTILFLCITENSYI